MAASLLATRILWCQALATEPVRLTVAVPESADTISLGVMDSNGRLVRTLSSHAPLSSFATHLNGIGVEWDGRDGNGNILAPGTYSISGFSFPDTLTVEGEAVHFNSLFSEDGRPVAESISSLVDLSPARLVTRSPSSEEETLWTLLDDGLPGDPSALGAGMRLVDATSDLFLLHDGSRWHLRPRNGSLPPVPVEAPPGAAALGKDWAIVDLSDNHLSVRSSADGREIRRVPLPAAISALAAFGDGFLLSDGKNLWVEQAGKIAAAPTPDLAEIFSMAAGPAGTFWVAGKTLAEAGGLPVARQYSPTGDVLRQIALAPSTQQAVLRGDNELRLGILAFDDTGVSLMGLAAPPGTPSIPESQGSEPTREVQWDILFEHRIEHINEPGFLDGQPVARGAQPSEPATFSLPANDLGPASLLVVNVHKENGGTWLASQEGLNLIEIAPIEPSFRPAWQKIDGNRLAVLIPIPGAVMEFTVKGIRGIVPLYGGQVDWKP